MAHVLHYLLHKESRLCFREVVGRNTDQTQTQPPLVNFLTQHTLQPDQTQTKAAKLIQSSFKARNAHRARKHLEFSFL